MPSVVVLVVTVLAIARVVRFLVDDELFRGPRQRMINWAYIRANSWIVDNARQKAGVAGMNMPGFDPETLERDQRNAYRNEYRAGLRLARQGDDVPKLAYMITCPWCVSIWVGAVAAPVVWFAGSTPWVFVPALALAASYVTGWLASHEGK